MFARVGQALLRRAGAAGAGAARPSAAAVARAPVRRMGSGGGGGGHDGHLHVSAPHLQVATVMTTLCWVWILWRGYEDGAVVLGLRHPWDGHGHGDHGHGHGAGGQFKETGFDTQPELEEAEEHEEEGEH